MAMVGGGGTVNFTTKSAEDFLTDNQLFGGLVKYSYHTNDKQNIYSTALFARNKTKTIDGLIYFTQRNGQNIQRPDGSQFLFSEQDNQSYLIKINTFPTEKQRLSFSAVHFSDIGWTPFAAKRSSDLSAPSNAEINKYGYDLAWKRKLVYRKLIDESYGLDYAYTADNPLWNIEAKFGMSKTTQRDQRPQEAAKYFAASMGNQSRTLYQDWHIEAANRALFATAAIEHQLTIGMQWQQSDRDVIMFDRSKEKNAQYHYGWYIPPYMPAGTQIRKSIFIEDKLYFEKLRLTLKPALRYDHIKNSGKTNIAPIYADIQAGHDYRTKSYAGWSPFFGLQWQAMQNVTLFADVSRTWRAPVIDEQYEVQYAKASITGTSRQLRKERLRSMQVGAVAAFDHILQTDDRLQWRTTLFQQRGKDEIFKTRGEVDKKIKPVANYRNLPGYTIEGIELEAHYHSPNFFGSIGYTQLKGRRAASPRDPHFPSKTYLAEIPPRTATLLFGLNIPSNDLSIAWQMKMIRRQDRSPSDHDTKAGYWSLPKTAGYTLHNLFLTWHPQRLLKGEVKFHFAIDNLFNKDYRNYLGEKVAGVGRNMKFSLAWTF